MCVDKLAQLGFSEKEAQIYLTLLRLGPSPASVLAQRVQFKRVTVYALLDALVERGLVNRVDTDQGRRYIPGAPDCLLELLEEEKNQLQHRIELAQECVHELENPANASRTSERRQVHFYEGLGATKKALSEYFMDSAPLHGLLSFAGLQDVNESLRFLHEQRQSVDGLTVYREVHGELFSAGALLVQHDTVAFLTQHSEVELMIIRDVFYAQYVRQVLFSPYFSKKSVGATISISSPVKG